MDWNDKGVMLSARKYGEGSSIIQVFTERHGRQSGLIHGGSGRKLRGVLQPGNQVEVVWRARLLEHLGTFTVEAVYAGSSKVLDNSERLAGLSAACATAEVVLPERLPHPRAYAGMIVLLEKIEASYAWPLIYVRWELGLLSELGFGLDLSTCARTGSVTGLEYVSPRTGRAVSRVGAGEYRDRLLKLPAFLLGSTIEDEEFLMSSSKNLYTAVLDGLSLTGYFLERYVLMDSGKILPPARRRLVERFHRHANIYGACD